LSFAVRVDFIHFFCCEADISVCDRRFVSEINFFAYLYSLKLLCEKKKEQRTNSNPYTSRGYARPAPAQVEDVLHMDLRYLALLRC